MSGWQLKNLDQAIALVSSEPIGSPAIDFKPIEIGLAPSEGAQRSSTSPSRWASWRKSRGP